MSLGSKFTKNARPLFDVDSFCTGCLCIMVAGRSWKPGSAFGGFIGGCIQSRGQSLQDLLPCCVLSPPASPGHLPFPESHAVFLHSSREAWSWVGSDQTWPEAGHTELCLNSGNLLPVLKPSVFPSGPGPSPSPLHRKPSPFSRRKFLKILQVHQPFCFSSFL